MIELLHTFKVQLFWEGHKNVRNHPYGFEIYLVTVKTMMTIAQIFVAFSEKLNFKKSVASSFCMNMFWKNSKQKGVLKMFNL